MTDIEKKAQLLENACALDMGLTSRTIRRDTFSTHEALCRAIEQHEAFRQEVSDAVEKHKAGMYLQDTALDRFIITKPDPRLAELWGELFHKGLNLDGFLAALAKRGLQVTEIEQ